MPDVRLNRPLTGWPEQRVRTRGSESKTMLRYTLHRVLLMIPTLLGVAVLVFFMLRIVPGDVVEMKLRGDGGSVSQETIEARARAARARQAAARRSSATGWSGSPRSISASRCGPSGR